MDSDHYVEEGFLTKTSLSHLLNHAVHNCPHLEKVVGECTKVQIQIQIQRSTSSDKPAKEFSAVNDVQVPDREIGQLEEDCARKGLPVKVRKKYLEFSQHISLDFIAIRSKAQESDSVH